MGEHFKRCLKWHQNTVKSQICYYSSEGGTAKDSRLGLESFKNIEKVLNEK